MYLDPVIQLFCYIPFFPFLSHPQLFVFLTPKYFAVRKNPFHKKKKYSKILELKISMKNKIVDDKTRRFLPWLHNKSSTQIQTSFTWVSSILPYLIQTKFGVKLFKGPEDENKVINFYMLSMMRTR